MTLEFSRLWFPLGYIEIESQQDLSRVVTIIVTMEIVWAWFYNRCNFSIRIENVAINVHVNIVFITIHCLKNMRPVIILTYIEIVIFWLPFSQSSSSNKN